MVKILMDFRDKLSLSQWGLAEGMGAEKVVGMDENIIHPCQLITFLFTEVCDWRVSWWKQISHRLHS